MALVDVVKFNGSPNMLAWKYPNDELGTWTQLIVNESQEAILVKGGQVLDVFGSGRHTLDSANIPILSKVINLPFGGRSPFKVEVWFINKAFNLDIRWGTPTPIQIQDPKYGIFAPVRVNGVFGIYVVDSKKFLVKLVATMPNFNTDSLIRYFRGLYITKVKDAISAYFVHKKISVLEINAYIDEISQALKESIKPVMDDYGIGLASFYVNEISVPEEDPAVKQLKNALSKRAEMNIIGYNYQQERSFDTLEGAAKNSGASSQFMGAGMGLGMGLGMGRGVGTGFTNMANEINTSSGTSNTKECPHCHAQIPMSQRFCGSCGFDTESAKKATETKPVCSACGATFAKGTKFCPECGRRINPCANCGSDIPDGAETCPICGKDLPKKCPNCGATLTGKVKFCPECGHSFFRKCPNCGAEIDGNQKFCPECGNQL